MCILCENLEWTWNKVLTDSKQEAFENLCFIHKDMAMMGNIK